MELNAETELLLNTISERLGLGPRGPKRDIRIPDPSHIGVVDSKYVRGSDVREFPKMLYRRVTVTPATPLGYVTKIVKTQEEQDAAKNWLSEPEEIHGLLTSLMPKPEEFQAVEFVDEKQEKKHRTAK